METGPREFCYFLQGFFEISGASDLDSKQVRIIKDKLDKVFVHETDKSKIDRRVSYPGNRLIKC